MIVLISGGIVRIYLTLLLLLFVLVIELSDKSGSLRCHVESITLTLGSGTIRLLLTLETSQNLLSLHAREVVALHHKYSTANFDDIVKFQRMQTADFAFSR